MTGNDVEYTYGTSGNETGHFLFWTEDCYGCEHRLCQSNEVSNRMHAAVDEKYSSYYAYDHSGERRVKLTGTNDLLDVNADYMYTASVLKEPTIYPSAYMVMSNRGYTSISPYAYCAWNPVKLVDPDGRDIYRLDAESGSLMLYKKNKKNYDVIEVGTTNKIGRATLFNKKSEKRISKGILEGKENQDISQTGFVTCSNRQEEALEVAVFISFSCHKELSGVGYEGIMRNQDLEVFAWASNTSNHSDNPVHYSPSKRRRIQIPFSYTLRK